MTSITCSSTRVTMVHVVQPQNVLVSKWTSLGVTTHLREGFLLKLMDLATCAAAEQLSGHSSVTFAVDDLIFHDTYLSVGETIVIKAQVNCAWGTSMECGCTVVADDGQNQRNICKAFFTYVSLDHNGKKIKLPKLQAIDPNNLRRNHLAQERRKIRFRRAAIIDHAASNNNNNNINGKTNNNNNSSTMEREDGGEDDKSYPLLIASLPLVMTEIVLPQHANHHGNTFGGQIMAWMSIAARVVASRHVSASAAAMSNNNINNTSVIVCKSIDDIFFKAASNTGDRVVIQARVTRIFARTLEVQCEVHAHQVGGEKRLINQAVWVMELMPEEKSDDHNNNNNELLLQVDFNYSDEARIAFDQALGRMALRIQRAALGSGHNVDPSWNFESDISSKEISKVDHHSRHGHHVELIARNMSSLLNAFWARGNAVRGWGELEQASTKSTKLYMRKEGGLIVVKAVASLSFTKEAFSKNKREQNERIFGLLRPPDAESALGQLFSVLCDNSQRKSWDLLCEDCNTIKELDDTNDITRLCFKGIVGDQKKSKSDFVLLRSWRVNENCTRYVIANHSIRTKLCPTVEGVKRGAVGSSGWVMELVNNDGGETTTKQVCELTYLVTLAAAGIQALGGTAIDVLAGRSKVICHNIEGIAKVVNATLVV